MDILDLFLDLSGLQDRCVPGSYGRWGKQWVHRQGDAAAYICKTETRRIIRCKGKAVTRVVICLKFAEILCHFHFSTVGFLPLRLGQETQRTPCILATFVLLSYCKGREAHFDY